jgi:succinate dehydrogenase/fumarate reductase flavoprotein subunit
MYKGEVTMYGMEVIPMGMNQVGITKAHVTGFVVGVGVAAAGYYVYMKNKDQVDAFLERHGIPVSSTKVEDFSLLTLEELLLKKEAIEDVIAEKEMALDQGMVVAEA